MFLSTSFRFCVSSSLKFKSLNLKSKHDISKKFFVKFDLKIGIIVRWNCYYRKKNAISSKNVVEFLDFTPKIKEKLKNPTIFLPVVCGISLFLVWFHYFQWYSKLATETIKIYSVPNSKNNGNQKLHISISMMYR